MFWHELLYSNYLFLLTELIHVKDILGRQQKTSSKINICVWHFSDFHVTCRHIYYLRDSQQVWEVLSPSHAHTIFLKGHWHQIFTSSFFFFMQKAITGVQHFLQHFDCGFEWLRLRIQSLFQDAAKDSTLRWLVWLTKKRDKIFRAIIPL
jgi:hypothetical protein